MLCYVTICNYYLIVYCVAYNVVTGNQNCISMWFSLNSETDASGDIPLI